MIYDSVTSGIEAATVAWHPLGWTPGWFSEIAPFPCKVLQHHYPHVPNYGDMLTLIDNPKIYESTASLLVGGTPCQDFSVAGLRGGLSGKNNSNLALEFCRLLIARQYRWFVWENVPGVHSSFSNAAGSPDLVGEGYGNGADITETADFATLLTAFRECGYCCAWRVLDAQYFGIPQRRRRVYVVGYLGNDWRPPAAVLFEPESVRGNIKAGQKKRQKAAGRFGKGTNGRHEWPATIAGTLDTKFGDKQGIEDQHINGGASLFVPHTVGALLAKSCADFGAAQVDAGQYIVVQNHRKEEKTIAGPLTARTKGGGFPGTDDALAGYIISFSAKDDGRGAAANIAPTVQSQQTGLACTTGLGIRRLTPLECERLQGFPDNYTNIPGAKDSPRYEALGNSMPVPVMRWIGRRIDLVDKIFQK